MTAEELLGFWFEDVGSERWFVKDLELDGEIVGRFQGVHGQAVAGELFAWRASARGRLAEIILIDQFSRNMFRGTPDAFRYDPIALVLAQEAVLQKLDQQLSKEQLPFLYMPYMHSESLVVHEQAMQLYAAPGLERSLEYEIAHKTIIEQFGRYPHRNEILGRESSVEELAFLRQPNSSF